VFLLAWYWPQVRDEFFVLLGSRNESGGWYGVWSGFGGALPDVMIGTALAAWYWHRNCHVRRCWRLGRHPVDGTPYITCRRHHPRIPSEVTAEHVAEAQRGQT
jgi:hypothetical protein